MTRPSCAKKKKKIIFCCCRWHCPAPHKQYQRWLVTSTSDTMQRCGCQWSRIHISVLTPLISQACKSLMKFQSDWKLSLPEVWNMEVRVDIWNLLQSEWSVFILYDFTSIYSFNLDRTPRQQCTVGSNTLRLSASFSSDSPSLLQFLSAFIFMIFCLVFHYFPSPAHPTLSLHLLAFITASPLSSSLPHYFHSPLPWILHSPLSLFLEK